MSRWMKTGRRRIAALVAVAGMLLGLAVTASTQWSAWASDSSTKYLGVFQETTPTTVASNYVGEYGVAPASVIKYLRGNPWLQPWGGNGHSALVGHGRATGGWPSG